MDKTLSHTYQLQINESFCGPAATRVALSIRGNSPSQQEIAGVLHTTADGTDSVNNVIAGMRWYLGDPANYKAVFIPGQDATASEAATLRQNLVSSINAGYGVVCNIAGPISTLDGGWYSYPGGHYVTVVGYANDGATFLIADVYTREYWVTAAALATWVASRGYAYSAVTTEGAPVAETILWIWDASDYDFNRGMRPANVVAAAREGIKVFTHKATETAPGQVFYHYQYGPMLTAARDAGIPFLGAYVVPRTGVDMAVQVQNAIAFVQEQTPWALTHPGFFWQVDLEHWGYDDVAPALGYDMANRLTAATGRRAVIYAPRWAYENSLLRGYPLWSSDYSQSGAARGFKDMYPGDAAKGWEAYSGQTPRIFQYTSSAIIGGQPGCDASAFWGSSDDFRRLIVGDDMALTDDEKAALMGMNVAPANANVFWARAAVDGKDPELAKYPGAPVVIGNKQLADKIDALGKAPTPVIDYNALAAALQPLIVKAVADELAKRLQS